MGRAISGVGRRSVSNRPVHAPPHGASVATATRGSVSPRQRESRRMRELEMYLRGVPLREIAAEVGMTIGGISKDLAELRAEFHREQRMSRVDRIALELAKIDHLERTYWDAWERSLREQIRTVTSREDVPLDLPKGANTGRTDGNGDPAPNTPVMLTKTRVQRRVDQSMGNPAFLAGIQWCVDRRVKLLGLDEPVKIDVNAQVRRIADDMGLDVQFVEAQVSAVGREWQQQKALVTEHAEVLE
jgi:hypothetical protein